MTKDEMDEVNQIIGLTRQVNRDPSLAAALHSDPLAMAQQTGTTTRVALIVDESALAPEDTPEYRWWH